MGQRREDVTFLCATPCFSPITQKRRLVAKRLKKSDESKVDHSKTSILTCYTLFDQRITCAKKNRNYVKTKIALTGLTDFVSGT